MIYNSNATIEDLVNKDTDGDGVLDWEEGLWGTDPTKKETTPGISDKVAIEKLKAGRPAAEIDGIKASPQQDGLNGADNIGTGMTQTDKFSRELFATISTLNQNGNIDQATIDKLSDSLAERIQNSAPRKIYLLSDINVIKDDSLQTIKKYNNTLNNIDQKYKANYTVFDILQKFAIDENNVDVAVLSELDPIIENLNKTIIDMAKMSVPQSLSILHLAVINTLEKIAENISDIQLYDTDVIISLSAITQYNQNINTLESNTGVLGNAIRKKLNTM